jgi:PAS domain S-box-containing protein
MRSQFATFNYEKLFHELFHLSSTGVCLTDEEGKYLMVNKAYCTITGYTQEELLGNNILLLVAPENREAVWKVYKQVFNLRHDAPSEWEIVRKDGTLAKVLLIASLYVDEFGKPLKITTLIDITDKLEAETESVKLAEKLRMASLAAGLGIWESHDLVNSKWNEKLYEIFEIEDPGRFQPHFDQWAKLLHPNDRDRVIAQLNRSRVHGEHYQLSYRIITPRGNVKYLYEIGQVFKDEAGRPQWMLGINWDITEQKEKEHELEEQNRELAKINKELDRFVYSASHDLRAPLTSMMGLNHLMAQSENLLEIRGYLNLQEKVLKRLDLFIQEITDFSRNVRMDMHRNLIDFPALCNSVFDALGFMENSAVVQKDLLMTGQTDTDFYSDEKRLLVVLSNLVSNAIRYARTDREAFVKITVHVGSRKAIISVSDNGQGIAKEHHDKIFDMFYRASDCNTGSGLGLYIVQETVAKLHGQVTFISAPGWGSTFQVEIPNMAPV